ncbi:Cyclic AMP-dependent protein kinase [Phytophthora megakarya]|uniref:Cyclic AMP-dependent protein kinase n=1 Tax=Phytophthora megakarya TaxID=4795 RepID=A0A225VEB7_9STRA|nr:Cyclic AMP-dependent protein kinase [Phytophthora megakarya]
MYLLQAQKKNPVSYRPQMIGLVERFYRTWKDCVATYMSDENMYSYDSGNHSTVALSPNELMMGRELRTSDELLRATHVTEAGDLTEYH